MMTSAGRVTSATAVGMCIGFVGLAGSAYRYTLNVFIHAPPEKNLSPAGELIEDDDGHHGHGAETHAETKEEHAEPEDSATEEEESESEEESEDSSEDESEGDSDESEEESDDSDDEERRKRKEEDDE